jgi:hypothetical protein
MGGMSDLGITTAAVALPYGAVLMQALVLSGKCGKRHRHQLITHQKTLFNKCEQKTLMAGN